MDIFDDTSARLKELIPLYLPGSSDRGQFLHGLLRKTDCMIDAIIITNPIGPIWPLHGRWVIEAFAVANRLNKSESYIASIKREGMTSYLLAADLPDSERIEVLNSIGDKPDRISQLLQDFDESGDLLYKVYRLLCEYVHFGFERTCAFPLWGSESPEVLNRREKFFESVICACALSIPALCHCPPDCGFSDIDFEKAIAASKEGFSNLDVE